MIVDDTSFSVSAPLSASDVGVSRRVASYSEKKLAIIVGKVAQNTPLVRSPGSPGADISAS